MFTNKNTNVLKRMNRDSHTILSKNKPKVRIIHIFAPEIIKTDPANFMELVQRLTGKPSSSTREKKINGKRSKKSFVRYDDEKRSDDHGVERVKCEEEVADQIWRPSSSSSGGSGCNDEEYSGGFLEGFGDEEDVFMTQLGFIDQPCLDYVLPQNHNTFLMHQHHQHHQKQQQHRFFGEEDHTDHDNGVSFDR